jgi:hypothetical protein
MKLLSSSFWAALVASASLALAGCSGASNAIGGGGNQTCTTTPCGIGDNSIQTCTTEPSGGCSTVTYTVGGQSFQCNSCSGCTSAAQQAATACVNGPTDGGTGNDGGVTDGGDSGVCSAPVACGSGGRTYEECTIVGAGGACVSIDYRTSDGHNFSCPGCESCAAIAEDLQSYCATPPSDSGTGQTACSTSVACGNTGTTYEECTTTSGGACESIEYKLSNGLSYACASCSNCSAAQQSLDAYCSGTVSPTTNCTSWANCGGSSLEYEECTTSLNGTCESIYYQTSDSEMFQCNSCGDCGAALSSMESYCASTETPVTTCGAYAACGDGSVEYELCTTTTGGACTSEYYSTTDGNTFSCTGCDCSSASTSLANYCASLTENTCSPACTSGYLCCNCSGTEECLSSGGGIDTCASYGCE